MTRAKHAELSRVVNERIALLKKQSTWKYADAARFAELTERLRVLAPRVTPKDRAILEDIKREVDAISRETDAVAKRFNLPRGRP